MHARPGCAVAPIGVAIQYGTTNADGYSISKLFSVFDFATHCHTVPPVGSPVAPGGVPVRSGGRYTVYGYDISLYFFTISPRRAGQVNACERMPIDSYDFLIDFCITLSVQRFRFSDFRLQVPFSQQIAADLQMSASSVHGAM